MNLLEKLNSISKEPMKPALPDNEYAETVGQFWTSFIKPSKDYIETAKKWHNLLMEYIRRPEAVFCIRAYDTGDQANRRRGFYTQTNKGYSFVYTDNGAAKYFCKMCIDNYVPRDGNPSQGAEELEDVFKQFAFPVADRRENKKIPCVSGSLFSNYYLAHIISVGDVPYQIDRNDLIKQYFNGENREEWNNKDHIRKNFEFKDMGKACLIAMFLRYVHPFNYFVVPASSYAKCAANDIHYTRNNVGEHEPVTGYVQKKYSELFGKEYMEFLQLAMYLDRSFKQASSKTIIKLKYGLKI